MPDIEIRNEVPPEIQQQIPEEVRRDIERTLLSLEHDERRFEVTFWTGIALLSAKYGLAAVSATLSTMSGYGAMIAGGASLGFGIKYLVNSIRNHRRTYVITEKRERR